MSFGGGVDGVGYVERMTASRSWGVISSVMMVVAEEVGNEPESVCSGGMGVSSEVMEASML